MRRSLTLGVLIAIFGIALACDNASSPSAPLRLPPVSPAPPAPPAPQPTASLAIEHTSLVVQPCPQGCGTNAFLYWPRFQLRETSGKSGATIQTFLVGGDRTGPDCWGPALRVPAGGTLDTFYSDEGWKWLGYCGVWGSGKSAVATVHVSVTFADDNGVAATVYADVSGGP